MLETWKKWVVPRSSACLRGIAAHVVLPNATPCRDANAIAFAQQPGRPAGVGPVLGFPVSPGPSVLTAGLSFLP